MPKKTAPKKAAKKPTPKAPKAVKTRAAKPAAPVKPPLDDALIGETAGAVWVALHEGGPQTLTAVKKSVAATDEAALMAIGWLAREGKLNFAKAGRSVKVSLR